MSLNNSRLAYEDCYDILDKALEIDGGVRVEFDNEEDATFHRMRLNQARQLDRTFNRDRYPNPEHPKHRRSDYDGLMFRVRKREEKWWIYVERKAIMGAVEEIKKQNKTEKPIREVVTYRRY